MNIVYFSAQTQPIFDPWNWLNFHARQFVQQELSEWVIFEEKGLIPMLKEQTAKVIKINRCLADAKPFFYVILFSKYASCCVGQVKGS